MSSPKGAVFADRDGTLVKVYDGRPANTVEELELLPGVADGVRKLKSLDLRIIIVSNQGGIGLGYMSEATMHGMNVRLNELLVEAGSQPVDAFYFCPHRPNEHCRCRKPNPGMFIDAQQKMGINFSRSYMVGDDVRDMDAAVRAGVRWPLMVVSDRYQDTPLARMTFPTFRDVAKAICILEAYGR